MASLQTSLIYYNPPHCPQVLFTVKNLDVALNDSVLSLAVMTSDDPHFEYFPRAFGK